MLRAYLLLLGDSMIGPQGKGFRSLLCVLVTSGALLIRLCDHQNFPGEPITVPASDSTPPAARLTVLVPNQPNKEITSKDNNYSITLPPASQDISLIAFGEDTDGGVKNIAVDGEIKVECQSARFGSISYPRYIKENADNAQVGGTAQTQRLTSLTISVGDLMKCEPGYIFKSMHGEFSATAENFHGGKDTTKSFIFDVTAH